MKLQKLYDYLIDLTKQALDAQEQEKSNQHGCSKSPKRIVDEQIYKDGFFAPFALNPSASSWDLTTLFLLNAVNGNGNPWIVYDGGRVGYCQAKVKHVQEALSQFTSHHTELTDAEKLQKLEDVLIDPSSHLENGLESLSALLARPELPAAIHGCSWREHAKAALRFLKATGWHRYETLQSFLESQGLGNDTKIDHLLPESAWNLLIRFRTGNWKKILNENINIPHVSVEKAANFFADVGFLNFSKPDVHMRKTYAYFFENNHVTPRQAFFKHNEVAKELAAGAEPIYGQDNFKPRHLDRMIWLAGSGRLIDDRNTAPYTYDVRRREVASILRNG